MAFRRGGRRSSGFSRGARRRTGWEEGPGGLTVWTTVLSATGSAFIGLAAAAVEDGLTLVRTIGRVQLKELTAAGGSTDGWCGAVGLGVAPATAVAAGIASVPTPLTEVDNENWLWWQPFAVAFGSAVLDPDIRQMNLPFDIRAMRRLEIGETDTLYLAIEATETGAGALQAFADSRILLKLP